MSRSPVCLFLAALCAAVVAASPVLADSPLEEVALLAGVFDVGEADPAIEGGVEVRFRPFRSGEAPIPWRLGLAAGAVVTDAGGRFAWSGFRLEIPRGDRFALIPQAAVAVYGRGDGKDLGGSLQFRTGLELAWKLSPRQRLGLVYYHLSNAGIERPNPGSESLSLIWAWSR